ncbi:MAG: hypothetical protein Q9221_004682 [Calogaya cf. arnoldii]
MEGNVVMTVHVLSLIGLGVPVVLLSARLCSLSVGHLLKTTGAKSVLVSPRLRSVVTEALTSGGNDEEFRVSEIKICDPAASDVIFASSKDRLDGNIAHTNHYNSETDSDVLVLHSSGSTGLPKPVYCSHRHLLGFACCHDFVSDQIAQGLVISTSPLFHVSIASSPPSIIRAQVPLGVRNSPYVSVTWGRKAVLYSPIVCDTYGRFSDGPRKDARAKALLTVPSILEEIALLPGQRGISALQKLDFVAVGGGLPKEAIAQKLSLAGVKLINHYGATETGPLSPFFQPPLGHDWYFFQIRTDIVKPLKVQLDPLDEPDQRGLAFKLSMQPFRWDERYELQDMLIGNSDGSANSFTAAGRTDDLICLATGEKVRLTILEDLLQQNEGVKAATAFGNNQFELGVIVETMALLRPSEHDSFKASIWPAIEEAGRRMDAHGRISSQTAIIIVHPMALPRSDKGTVLRKEVYQSFEKEILDVYHELEVSVTAPPIDLTSPVSSIRSLIITNWPRFVLHDGFTENKDLFELGMDSLQRLDYADCLLPLLGPRGDFVYRHPSVTKMAEALMDGLSQGKNETSDSANFNRILHEASGGLGVSDDQHTSTVLITGSTGSLGSYLLCKLLGNPDVKRVFCLNRTSGEDAYYRQKHALRAKGIELPKMPGLESRFSRPTQTIRIWDSAKPSTNS